jgi:CO dehydrogenase/acetyl-CoA synthase epsilon subunit
MILIKKKGFEDYACLKFYNFLFDKNFNGLYSSDFGLLLGNRTYYLSDCVIFVKRFYKGQGSIMVEFTYLGQVSLHTFSINVFLYKLWLCNIRKFYKKF